MRAAAGDEHQDGGVERVGEIADDAVDVAGGERADVAHDHHAVRGHERRAPGRVQHRGDRRLATLGAGGASDSSPRPGAARDGDLLEREAAVVVAEQLGDEVVDDAVAQRRVGPLHQVGAGAHPLTARSIASIMRQTATDPATSWTRTMRQPWATPYATDASDAARRSSMVEVEQLAEEPLVRRRQQERVAERGQRVALAQQHRALRRGLAEVEAGVERDLLAARVPAASACAGAVEEERGDVGEQVVVVRLGIGDARLQPDVGRDHRRAVLGRDGEVVGIGEAADVVADDRAGLARLVEHRGAPRVARDRRRRSARAARRSGARRGRAPRPRRPRDRDRPSRRRRRGGRRPRRPAPRRAAAASRARRCAPWS